MADLREQGSFDTPTPVDRGKHSQQLWCNLVWSDSLFFLHLEKGLCKGFLVATIDGKAVGDVEEEKPS